MTNENAVDEAEKTIDWEARALKAENKIVQMKQKPKEEEKKEETPAATVENKEEVTPEVKKEDSSELDVLKTKIAELEQEKTINNNVSATNAMSISGNEATDTWFSSISSWDFDKMSQSERSEYMSNSMKANWDEVVFS